MRESFSNTERLNISRINLVKVNKILESVKTAERDIFEASTKEEIKKAESAKKRAIAKGKILIQEYKKIINEIDRARTNGKLSSRYDYSSDHENLATKEVEELEDAIRWLEAGWKRPKDEQNSKDQEGVKETPPLPEAKSDDEPKPDDLKDGDEESLENIPVEPDKKTEDKRDDDEGSSGGGERPEETKSEAERIREKRRRLGVVKTDLIEKRAADIAAERMTADKNSLKGVSGFFKKIWKHNWGAEINRAKQTKKIKEELALAGSAFASDDVGGLKDKAIKDSVLKRFLEDGTELIHFDAEEWKDTEISLEKRNQAENELKDAIRSYAISPDPIQAELDFKAERDRIYAGLFADKKGSFDALGVADNVFEFAKEMRAKVEHGIAVADLDLDFELIFGEAKTGVRTEPQYSWSEKMVKKIMSAPGGRFLNETTIAGAVTIAMMLGKIGTGRGARAALGLAGGVVLAGGIAGLRESQAMERDRTEHARAMAAGRAFDPTNAPRRVELEAAMYDMMNVKNATDDLHNILFENIGGLERKKTPLSQSDIDSAMEHLAQIDSRVKLSDLEKIDLLSYGDEAMVEIERTNLDIERATAKSILRDAFAANPSLGVFDDKINALIDVKQIELRDNTGGIKEKDAAFKKIKRTHVVKAMAKGVIGGLAFGVIAQEGMSLINGQQGVIEGVRGTGSGENVTSLEWAREKIYAAFGWDTSTVDSQISIPGQTAVNSLVVGGVSHEVTQSVNSFLKLPAGYEINPSGSHRGVYEILFNGKKVVDAVEVDLNTGELTPNSLSALQKAGFNINTKVDHLYDSVVSGTKGTETSLTQDFIDKHSDKFAKIKRLGWADNDTERPDGNEVKLWDPVEKNGMYQYQVKMNSVDSVFNGQNIDPVKLASEGKLKALISLSRDTQGHPVEVPIKYEGGKMTFDVDPKDPILGQLFHKAPNGEIICDARYIEVGAEMGSKNGVKEFIMCATEEGKGVSKMGGESTVISAKDYLTKNVNINLEKSKDIVLPPIIPILPRTPLEQTKTKKPTISPYYGIANPKEILEEMERNGVEPDSYFVKNVDGEAVWVDKDGKLIERSKEREDERVGKYLEKQDKTFIEELKAFEKNVEPMNEKCRVAINIPARFEEKNLANLLTQYVKQVDENGAPIDKDLFEINVIVNRKEGEKADRSMQIIEDWKKKNPGYHINAVDITFPVAKANVGMARKYITDLTLLRSKNRKTKTGPLYIESEDADLFSVDKRTVAKLIRDFDSKPQLDVLRGVQDRQPEIMQKNDLLFFERRLGDMAETFMRRQAYRPEKMKGSSFVWNRVISGGWNTAFTAESYAQIGGYVSDVIGEDMKIGQKISMLRGYKNEKNEYIPNTQTAKASGLRFSSSPRRFIDAMIKSRGAYDDFEDQSLKEKTLDELMDGIKEYSKATPDQIKKYETSISWVGKFIGEQMVQPQAKDVFKRVLWGIGLKENHYILKEDNSIELNLAGMERIIDLLKKYKEAEKYKLGYRRQNANL